MVACCVTPDGGTKTAASFVVVDVEEERNNGEDFNGLTNSKGADMKRKDEAQSLLSKEDSKDDVAQDDPRAAPEIDPLSHRVTMPKWRWARTALLAVTLAPLRQDKLIGIVNISI